MKSIKTILINDYRSAIRQMPGNIKQNRREAAAGMNYIEMGHKLESSYKKYRGILKNLTIMRDIFMRNVFKNLH